MMLAEVLHAAAEQFDPSDGIDLLGMLIVIIPSTIAAIGVVYVSVITVRGQKRGRERRNEDRAVLDEMAEKVDVVRGEVKNDHGDDQNLRDQIDRMERQQTRMVEAITDLTGTVAEVRGRQIDHGLDIGGIRDDIGGLRGEVRQDRQDAARDRRNLSDFEARVQGFIRREHPGADPL